MVNYTNSKVYKIWSTQGDKIYIGSTTKQYLSQRMDKHRTDYKRWKDNRSNFITSFKIFEEYGLENCFIELIESKECNSKDELLKIEGKYIRELECVNKITPCRTQIECKEYQKDYYEDNKEQLLEHMKVYRENHKEKISEAQRQYRELNKEKTNHKNTCECGGSYSLANKSTHQKTLKHCQYIETQIIKPEVDEV